MAVTLINGNQISSLTNATINQLQFTNTTSILQLPTGTTVQRPSTAAYGTMRFNTTEDKVEVYVTNSNGQGLDGWSFVGAGGPHVGNKSTSYIRTNSSSINEDITIGPIANGGNEYTNAILVGPVEIASGFTITIETGAVLFVAGNDEGPVTTMENVIVYQSLDLMSGRFDFGPTREKIVPYNFSGASDSMLPINYTEGNIIWCTGQLTNFSINIINMPISQISAGQTGTNKSFGFIIVVQQGSTAFRPSGTLMLEGAATSNITWSGGAAPTPNANRRSIFGLTLMRVTSTNSSGSTSTNWWPFMSMSEFA